MAKKHARDTYISLDGHDISFCTNTSELEVGADEHDVTCYGADSHEVDGGLGNGKVSMGGWYDDTSSGAKAIIEPLVGTRVTLIRRPLGTGTGKPQESLTVLVVKYVESSPVADYIAWSCDLTKSGDVTRTTQG